MIFNCAAVVEGTKCSSGDAGGTAYLGILEFCKEHQDAFEGAVNSGTLAREVISATMMRSPLGGVFQALIDGAKRRALSPVSEAPRDMRSEATVYFFHCQGFVKIGYSKDPLSRLRQIRSMDGTKYPEGMDCSTATLITTEPGGFDRERELHAKFSHLRHTGEWFTEAPELAEYIASTEADASDGARLSHSHLERLDTAA